ncbi:carboxypeptidase-like regulatory domain-containing protein [Belliella baltica]|uniref:carboxypeptidase-like regulatory domain-containing protein n=1 Tax=Belliella baltica TaxID=232259 RepID=UPI0002F5BFB0|nr:carboxypeptidase-like regulatory domain-containing protein [Belliella baltica]
MKAFAIFFLFILTQQVLAQTSIKGVVKDQKGETIPGVNIFLKGTYEGVSSEIDGNYILETTLTGEYILVFQAMGYNSLEKEISLEGESLILEVTLREAINEMTAVTISAGAMEASDEKKAVVLKPIDIVTVPSAMGDIIGAF